MKNEELKAELKKCRLAVGGKKSVLIERLQRSIKEKVPIFQPGTDTQDSSATKCNLGVCSVFSLGSYWKFLTPNNEPVPNPIANTLFHSPTNPEKINPTLHNYSIEFDRPPFVAQVKSPKLNNFQKRTRDKYSDVEYEMNPVGDHGAPQQDFLDCHRLDENSLPEHFF